MNIPDGISKYKRNKPIQIKEQIKDHRLMLCFIAFSYVIKIFFYNFNGKYKKKIAVINWNKVLNKIILLKKWRFINGKSQRDNGMRREREFASLIGGARVPLSGAMDGYSNDVKGFRS
ncbi:hypothetical protein CN335_12420 [Bacillus thuringiensis]|nr:hypothetical protein CN335_12420 [Bacillus thuringiensis]PFT16191.1 hypothetical protein COK83_11400 [Bacillus thuringiensis]